MEILSWNIQAAKGVDNLVSVERIASDIKQFSNADIICLQEVLRTDEHDQVAQLGTAFPDYYPVYGAAINRLADTGRLEFGNLILSRLPVVQVVQHKLPQPAEPDAKPMPRQAIELLLDYQGELIRVTTTHLEFFAQQQRTAQVRYLAQRYLESLERHQRPSPAGGEQQFATLPETQHSILCGDFNLTVDSADYHSMQEPDQESPLIDCWRHVHGDTPHAPTCGIFDHVQWQEGAHCRDFIFASPSLANRVSDMQVNVDTAASDHQPLKISLD